MDIRGISRGEIHLTIHFRKFVIFSFIVFYHSVSAEFYKADYLFIIVQERDLKEIGKRKGIGE